MANSIGDFEFISLRGEVVAPAEELAPPMARPGVDGVGLLKTGSRGRRFRLRAMVDAQSLDEARTTFKSYRELVGADPVTLVQDDYDYDGQEDFKCAVLGVRLAEPIRTISTAVGGLNSPSEAKLVTQWDLIAVANTE